MRKLLHFSLFLLCGLQSFAQDDLQKELKKYVPKFGIKAGYNVAKLTGSTPSFDPSTAGGFNTAVFYSPVTNGIGYRTELVFSRQGFSYTETGNKETVLQDYVYMPHLTTFTIAKKVQLQAGGQIGYLLSAKKDEAKTPAEEQSFADQMNRLDFGAAVGVEVYPVAGFIIAARYNVSTTNPYKAAESGTFPGSINPYPLPVNPADFKGKNAVLQFSVGYRF